MKKFLAIIAIASFAVACNNKAEKTTTEDTTSVVTPVDTTTPLVIDTTTAPVLDTTSK